MQLAEIRVYPIKSCRGVRPARWELDALGLRYDRSFMVVAAGGRFLTQREQPKLALVETRIEGDTLHLTAPGQTPLEIPLAMATGERTEIEVWRHRGPALDQGDQAAALLSSHLGLQCRLVRLPPGHVRRVNQAFFPGEAHTAFTDGYPMLLLSEASLADLNARLTTPLPMDRFRPNLVVRGCAPYAEDGWKRIRIGDIEMAVVKPCDRCVVTTTDQTTGERAGSEPLRTLATYRTEDNKVLFGQNLVHLGRGAIEVGAKIQVLEASAKRAQRGAGERRPLPDGEAGGAA
jgi:uncharacterized protein YcbX